jgi:hypothetical protein
VRSAPALLLPIFIPLRCPSALPAPQPTRDAAFSIAAQRQTMPRLRHIIATSSPRHALATDHAACSPHHIAAEQIFIATISATRESRCCADVRRCLRVSFVSPPSRRV